MKNKNVPNLEWFNNIKKLNEEKRMLKDLPENERVLYIEEFGELSYNWDRIYDLLFNKDIEDELIDSKDAIPNGIKELYEIDEQGNPTGYFDWDYAMSICESISGTNVHKMWDTEYTDEIYELICSMPDHVGYIISNIDNPEELYGDLIKDLPEPDLDCPKEIRENPELIYEIMELCNNYEDIINCFDFMSDELKNDKKFLAKLLNLENLKKDGDVLLFKIDPELAKKINDENDRRTKDNDVLEVMKKAVGKTIGRTLNAENSLDDNKINENDNKGEEYGDY